MSLGDLSAPVLKSHGSGNEVAQTSANMFAAPPSNPNRPFAQGVAPQYVAAAVGVVAAGVVVKNLLDTPSARTQQGPDGASVGTVGEEYDAWTEEGILEYYWGEHIHLGYYTDEDMAKGAGTLAGATSRISSRPSLTSWTRCWSGRSAL